MLADVLTTAGGLVLLIAGGESMVRGVSTLAIRVGISTLVIGLTVVAFGTSAPELAVNVAAVRSGATGLPFGNIMGSNLANIGLIVAVAALIRPLDVQSVVLRRELPMMLLATFLASVLALDAFFGDGMNRYAGSDGVVLLLIFTIFLYYTGRDMLRERASRTRILRGQKADDVDENDSRGQDSVPKSVMLMLAGFAGLLIGGALTVDGATGVARAFGVSEAIIGLTLVALGTSLPELVASIIACLRGHTDLAVGNVVGSNIFNLLAVLGLTASVGQIDVPAGGFLDLMAVCAMSLLFWVLTITDRGRVIRTEGILLLALYIGYIGFRVVYNVANVAEPSL
jgi:cation:H+ antiporter